MEFAEFAARAREIEMESADLAIISLVATLLQDADGDLAIVARFIQGRVFPAWESTTLDIGPSLCYEAIARAAGPDVTMADVEDRLAERGEIGEVAASFEFGGQQDLTAYGDSSSGLTLEAVYEDLRRLAEASGPGSQGKKVDLLFNLFNQCSPDEARYLARLVLGEMRIGVGEGTVRDGIAEAFDLPVDRVERAIQVSNDVGLVAETARDEGVAGLDAISLEVGRPIQSMLAQTGTVTEALDAWGEVAVEWKYDGARIQVHYDGEDVAIFSRNLEEVTEPLPEIVEFIEANLEVPAILDGEVVAVDDEGMPRPFQEVLRRFRRKYDVEETRQEVSLEPYFFDCLHADGEDLLDTPLRERQTHLESLLTKGISDQWYLAESEAIEAIEADALQAGHEGLMLKNPEAAYTPGRRGKNWLKRKPDVETLDCVVTGAEWGEGRRATFLGTFELGVRTADGYATVGHVATGITDDELAELTERLEPYIEAEQGTTVDITPAVVFEVGYEEIQKSPNYESGYALRFPRFLGVREDKDPENADTLERVKELA